MDRKEFLSKSGGMFTGYTLGSYAAESALIRYYWEFFSQPRFRKSVKAVYTDVVVDVLLREKKYSIEHVIPKSFLYERLKRKGHSRNLIRGALMNPFNFAPSHRRVNSLRSSIPFDLDGDRTQISFKNPQNQRPSEFGLDHENEWVVPVRSRGMIARSVLYMSRLYALSVPGLDIYEKWSTMHPPQTWEIDFNQWMLRRYQISNPYLSTHNAT